MTRISPDDPNLIKAQAIVAKVRAKLNTGNVVVSSSQARPQTPRNDPSNKMPTFYRPKVVIDKPPPNINTRKIVIKDKSQLQAHIPTVEWLNPNNKLTIMLVANDKNKKTLLRGLRILNPEFAGKLTGKVKITSFATGESPTIDEVSHSPTFIKTKKSNLHKFPTMITIENSCNLPLQISRDLTWIDLPLTETYQHLFVNESGGERQDNRQNAREDSLLDFVKLLLIILILFLVVEKFFK